MTIPCVNQEIHVDERLCRSTSDILGLQHGGIVYRDYDAWTRKKKYDPVHSESQSESSLSALGRCSEVSMFSARFSD